jgi:hypothetical protein
MFRRTRNSGGRAFDAGGSGSAFMSSQLEALDTDLTRPLQDVTHTRDITVKFGGGFIEFVSAFAANYASTGGNQYGLQANQNTDIAIVQADLQKGVWRTFNWAAAIFLGDIDLQRMQAAERLGMPAPISLQELYDEAVASVWAKAMDRLTYLGWLGYPGLINNPLVPEFTVAADSASHTTWAAKALDTNGSTAILQDVNSALNQTVQNSGYNIKEGMADTLLLPYAQYATITSPMTIAGCQSILEYIKRYSVAAMNGIDLKVYSLPSPWIAGQGAGSTDRAVAYKNSDKNVYLKVPQPMRTAMTVPTTRDGGGYETIFNGCMSQVIWKRTTTAVYMDGI